MTFQAVPIEPEAVPVPEACRILGTKRSKLYELMADGTLPSLKIGRRRLVRVAALRKIIADREQPRIERAA